MFGGGGEPDRFDDRTDAGRRLAEALRDRGTEADVVLAIPRGGLPLGRAVADALGLPLDVIVASKIGAPGNPEYAIGAAASDGSAWLDEAAIERSGADDEYVERERRREAENARRKAERYRGDRPEPDLRGKAVLLVDDGAATGSTAIAAVRLARERGADRVAVAVPVGPPAAIDDLEAEADEVVCPKVTPSFGAVGQFYRNFGQVTDEEAMAYLREE